MLSQEVKLLKEEKRFVLDPKVGTAKEVEQRVDAGNVKTRNIKLWDTHLLK